MDFRHRTPQAARRRVWRATQAAPDGEWVDPAATPLPPKSEEPEPESSSRGWAMSSFDLLYGADVVEDVDTIPAELFDELFGLRANSPKTSRK
jgi:hypothetical protein